MSMQYQRLGGGSGVLEGSVGSQRRCPCARRGSYRTALCFLVADRFSIFDHSFSRFTRLFWVLRSLFYHTITVVQLFGPLYCSLRRIVVLERDTVVCGCFLG